MAPPDSDVIDAVLAVTNHGGKSSKFSRDRHGIMRLHVTQYVIDPLKKDSAQIHISMEESALEDDHVASVDVAQQIFDSGNFGKTDPGISLVKLTFTFGVLTHVNGIGIEELALTTGRTEKYLRNFYSWRRANGKQ